MREPKDQERRIVVYGFLLLLMAALVICAIEGRDVTPIATALLGFLGGRYMKP